MTSGPTQWESHLCKVESFTFPVFVSNNSLVFVMVLGAKVVLLQERVIEDSVVLVLVVSKTAA